MTFTLLPTTLNEALREVKSWRERYKTHTKEIESLRQQLESMQLALKVMGAGNVKTLKQLTESQTKLVECQAREKILRDALKTVAQAFAWRVFGECRSYGEDVPVIEAVEAERISKNTLAMPSDSTALDSAIKQAKRKTLLEAIEFNWPLDSLTKELVQDVLRHMAKELE